jgi:hypothetical protein
METIALNYRQSQFIPEAIAYFDLHQDIKNKALKEIRKALKSFKSKGTIDV